MGLNDPGAIVVRDTLQKTSIAYRNTNFIADEVFPVITGLNRQARVTRYYKGPWFKDSAALRAPGSAARELHYNVTSENIDPINYAIATQVVDEEVQDASVPGALTVDPRVDAIEMLANSILIRQEVRTATVIKEALWSGQSAGGVDAEGGWGHSTAASDTFLTDMKTGRAAFHAAGAPMPNRLLLDHYAAEALQWAPALLDKIYPTGFGTADFVSLQALANLAQVERIIVGNAIYDDSEPTQSGDDTNFNTVDIWDSAGGTTKGLGFLYYKPLVAGKKTPSAGYNYKITQPNGSYRYSTGWRDSKTHSDWYDSQEETDITAVSLDCGYLWKDTATT